MLSREPRAPLAGPSMSTALRNRTYLCAGGLSVTLLRYLGAYCILQTPSSTGLVRGTHGRRPIPGTPLAAGTLPYSPPAMWPPSGMT
jgi:hypothetical protein